MAQSITWLGNTYTQVPAILLPKTGGGTARFTDTTPTTAIDSDVAQGKIYIKADGTQSTGTASGGGGGGGIEITQDAQGYLILPSTSGGGGGGGASEYGTIIVQNNTTFSVSIYSCENDANGNSVQNGLTVTIASQGTGQIPLTYQFNSTTRVNAVMTIQCPYSSNASALTITGQGTLYTYKIGTGGSAGRYAFAYVNEAVGSTVVLGV